MQVDDRMTIIEAITAPIIDMIKNIDDQVTHGSWEADLPGRGEDGGGIAIIFEGSNLEIVIKEEDPDLTEQFADMIKDQTEDEKGIIGYVEHAKTVNLANPNSLDVIMKVMKSISNGFSPVDGEDGWEEV